MKTKYKVVKTDYKYKPYIALVYKYKKWGPIYPHYDGLASEERYFTRRGAITAIRRLQKLEKKEANKYNNTVWEGVKNE